MMARQHRPTYGELCTTDDDLYPSPTLTFLYRVLSMSISSILHL